MNEDGMDMINILHNDTSQGNSTCFAPGSATGTDIDWVTATRAIAGNGWSRCTIHGGPLPGSAHRIMFAELQATEIMNISAQEIKQYSVMHLQVDPLKGKKDAPLIKRYNKILRKKREESKVDALITEAIEKQTPTAMDAAMNAIHETLASAANATKHTRRTGKRRKTYYSLDNMNIKKFTKFFCIITTAFLQKTH